MARHLRRDEIATPFGVKRKPALNRHIVEGLKDSKGCEVWTNALGERFGERVCVGIEFPFVWHLGKKYKLNNEEWNAIWNDYIHQELGSDSYIKKQLDEEFGWTRTASAEELMRRGGFTKREAEQIIRSRNKR